VLDIQKKSSDGTKVAADDAIVGIHPFQAVTTSRSASVFASDRGQNIVKTRHGLAGLIVVVPVYTQRVGDNSGTTAHFSALAKLWDQLQKTHSNITVNSSPAVTPGAAIASASAILH
jgi:hypothetical protein